MYSKDAFYKMKKLKMTLHEIIDHMRIQHERERFLLMENDAMMNYEVVILREYSGATLHHIMKKIGATFWKLAPHFGNRRRIF